MEIKIINQKYYLTTSDNNYLLTPLLLQKYPNLRTNTLVTDEQGFLVIFDYAYSEALKILTFSNKTSFEIKQKLLEKKYPFVVIDQVINKLTELKLLNDNNYVVEFAKKKINTYGKRIIILKLREKGLNESIIEENIKEISEEIVLEKQIPLKLKVHKGSFRVIKEKVHHYYYQKGYDSTLVNKIINHYLPLLNYNPIAELRNEYKKVAARFNGYQNNLKIRNNLIKYLQKKLFSVEDILEIIGS